jgi:hypothetical protein
VASILYLPSVNGLERRFLALLEMELPKKKFEICHSIGELSTRLRKPRSSVRVAVLFALNQEEIMRILSLGDLMADVKSILVLADDDRDTIMKAHTLRPRYVTWVDSDFKHIVNVLRNMVALYDVPFGNARNPRSRSSLKTRSLGMGKEGKEIHES